MGRQFALVPVLGGALLAILVGICIMGSDKRIVKVTGVLVPVMGVLYIIMAVIVMVLNIGMCLFIMPVIGLTLPFFSYGGSSLVTLFTAMGFVSGIKKRTVVRRRPGRPLGSNAVY